MTTPHDLDDRLSDLLARAADAVEVAPDLDAVLEGSTTPGPLVDLGRRPRDTRRLLALAAAVLVVVGVAAATVLAARADEPRTTEVTEGPAGPARYPVFGDLPAEVRDAHVEASAGDGSHHEVVGQTFDPGATVVRAALGKVAPDGTITDIVQLAAGTERTQWPDPVTPEVEELRDGYVLASGAGVLEVRGRGAIVEVHGPPAAEDLMRTVAGATLSARAGDDGEPVLTIGELPGGYSVIAPPTPATAAEAELATPSGPPCDAPSPARCDIPDATVVVQTGVGPPALAIMTAGEARPVAVGDGEGLVATDPDAPLTRVAWTAPGGVTLALWAQYPADQALEIARGIELVDEGTWRTTYPEWPDDAQAPVFETATTEATDATDTTEAGDTTSPEDAEPTTTAAADDGVAIGLPAPAYAGSIDGVGAFTPPHAEGRWAIVSFVAPWCVPCGEQLDLVADHMAEHPDGPAVPVTFVVDEEPGSAAAFLAEHGVTGRVLYATAAQVAPWPHGGPPWHVVVDPDGIVRASVGAFTRDDPVAEVLEELGAE